MKNLTMNLSLIILALTVVSCGGRGKNNSKTPSAIVGSKPTTEVIISDSNGQIVVDTIQKQNPQTPAEVPSVIVPEGEFTLVVISPEEVTETVINPDPDSESSTVVEVIVEAPTEIVISDELVAGPETITTPEDGADTNSEIGTVPEEDNSTVIEVVDTNLSKDIQQCLAQKKHECKKQYRSQLMHRIAVLEKRLLKPHMVLQKWIDELAELKKLLISLGK